jgi:hypothetical protein
MRQGGNQKERAMNTDETAAKVQRILSDSTIVKVWSPVLTKVKPTAKLFEWVATSGQERYFAHLRVIEEDRKNVMIILEHDLLGDYLDPDELMSTVASVLLGADEWDDELQKMFGGERAAD